MEEIYIKTIKIPHLPLFNIQGGPAKMLKWHLLPLTAYNFLINWSILFKFWYLDCKDNCLSDFLTVACLSSLWARTKDRTWSRLSKTRPWTETTLAPQPVAPQCWDWYGTSIRYPTFESSMCQHQLLQIYLSIDPWYQVNHGIY